MNIGDVFGRWTVTEIGLRKGVRQFAAARCVCECGRERVVVASTLRDGRSTSCGCFRGELVSIRNRSDPRWDTTSYSGASKHWLHQTWADMCRRCFATDHHNYPHYGARGITVHGPWRVFAVFRDYIEQNLGPRPEGYTMDRIDNDGDYEPGNLRWADAKTQNNNRRVSA